jgi:micrococcal nuclease
VYDYRATVVRWIDADTCVVHIDLGFRTWMHDEHLRLVGIDAPDRQPAKGTATAYVREAWPAGTRLIVRTHKDQADKYGRWLAELWEPGGVCLNAELVAAGMAVPWDGTGAHPPQPGEVTA